MSETPTVSLTALYNAFELDDATRHARACARLIRQGYDLASGLRAHVLGDDWFDYAATSLQAYFRSCAGHVYLVTGPAHHGLVKVGKTARTPQVRLCSLNNASVLLPLKLLQSFAVHDRHWVEAECHRQLARAGVRRAKEFFEAEEDDLARLIQTVCQEDRRRFEAQGFAGCLA